LGTLTPQSRLVRIGSARPLPPAKVSPNNNTESPALPPCGVFFYAIRVGMERGAVEYLFAAAVGVADQAARKQGWLPRGRTGWQKPDGTAIHFISFVEQIAIVPKEATIYFVGDARPELARFKRRWVAIPT
jgi:hypothetical protein